MNAPITLFLASSSELAAERSAVEIFLGRKNKLWAPRGQRLELVHWEDLDDAMSLAGKQADYNAAIGGCDIFVLLVHRKLGRYSESEFDTAWQCFSATKTRPRLYTYLKSPPELGEPEPGPQYASVRAFQQKLAALQHFPTAYHDANGLLLHLEQVLDRLDAMGAFQPTPQATTTIAPRSAAPALPATQVGAGGVCVGGGNSGNINTGTQHIGSQVMGGVHIGQGDYVAGHKTVHLGGGSAALLAQLLAEVQRLAPPAQRALAAEHVQALQEAAAAPAKPDDGKLARLLNGLVDLVPGAVGAVVATFASPVLGGLAGPATEALLKKLKG